MEIGVAAAVAGALMLALGWLLWGRPLGAVQAEATAARADAAAARSEADAAREAAVELRVAVRGHAVEVAAKQDRLVELQGVEAERDRLAAELAALKATQAERDAAHARQLADLHTAFAELAAKALDGAQTVFAERAEQVLARHREAAGAGLEANRTAMAELIAPMRETLSAYQARLDDIEKVRAEGYGALNTLLDQVAKGQERVTGATARLETVLRSSGKAAGRWGEEQCRNVLELAGLVEGVDFVAQTADGSDDSRRPDFVVTLPGERRLVIDVKCSVDAYMAAASADDGDERARHLAAHARAIRAHATGLAAKAYEKTVGGAVDFVVLFVPGENFLAAAFEQDRALLNDFMARRLVLAGPINLIAVARTVAAMRDQARLAKQAAEIAKLGRDLYDSIRIMGDNFAAVQKGLTGAVGSWNKLVAQVDSRVVGRARRFEALGATTGLEPIGEMKLVEALPLLPANLEGGAALAAE
ncbi:MAG: DNA recombination protein RmuC [Sphingomonadaceae bacterium]|nr:DNA recombination protein RmuC [Sphingomonadaceae bacterium]